MTIVVGVASPDGLVLAADSRTTYSEGDRHRIASDFSQKVFSVCGRWGVATSGNAFIGRDTVAGAMDQFIARISDSPPSGIDDFAQELEDFFNKLFLDQIEGEWDPDKHGFLVFLTAGYDDQGVGHIREVHVPGPSGTEASADTTSGGVMWRGQTGVIGRLLKGLDWAQLELIDLKLTEEQKVELEKLAYIALAPITLQDAVDYASFLVRTTIDMHRFSDGTPAEPGLVPGCGGATLALVVARKGTSWAAKPELQGP